MNRRFVKPFFNNFLKAKLIKFTQQNVGKIKPQLDNKEIYKEKDENKNTNQSDISKKIPLRFYSSVSSFKVGDEAVLEKQITEEDIKKFIEISGDSNPIHYNRENQKAMVHGAFLNSLVSNVIGTKLPGPGTVVAKQTLNFPNACFVGEAVKVHVKVTQVRKIIKVEYTCKAYGSEQPGKVVMFGEAQLLHKITEKEELEV